MDCILARVLESEHRFDFPNAMAPDAIQVVTGVVGSRLRSRGKPTLVASQPKSTVNPKGVRCVLGLRNKGTRQELSLTEGTFSGVVGALPGLLLKIADTHVATGASTALAIKFTLWGFRADPDTQVLSVAMLAEVVGSRPVGPAFGGTSGPQAQARAQAKALAQAKAKARAQAKRKVRAQAKRKADSLAAAGDCCCLDVLDEWLMLAFCSAAACCFILG